MELKMIPQPN